ncbi:MAG: GNAT family N-acetyltransferase [Candidatus Omnitrophica bacterium]|nr:GNAT family N-acetyltransferase [Candidatus Omnitrophota bacterium]
MKKSNLNYRIIRAVPEDVDELLALGKAAYQIEAERYNNFKIPQIKETGKELQEQFKDHIILKAVFNGKIIGSVRVCKKNGIGHIARLAVLPDYRCRGIGTALMLEAEKHSKCRRYELFTGTKSISNIKLYEKLGYSISKKEKYGCGDIEVFFMEKAVLSNFKRGILAGAVIFVAAQVISFGYEFIIMALIPPGTETTSAALFMMITVKIMDWICKPFSHFWLLYKNMIGYFPYKGLLLDLINLLGWLWIGFKINSGKK